MRIVIQRVLKGAVWVEGRVIGEIGKGYVIFLGIGDGDTEETADRYIDKILKLRIFEDDHGKTNLSLNDVEGEVLVISQFTLYADCRKGNRPSFTKAGSPQLGKELYEYVVFGFQNRLGKAACGSFGADMKVELINDGPFTICLDSDRD